jgi:hypothetical protein
LMLKNVWNFTSMPAVCLYGLVHRYKYIFLFSGNALAGMFMSLYHFEMCGMTWNKMIFHQHLVMKEFIIETDICDSWICVMKSSFCKLTFENIPWNVILDVQCTWLQCWMFWTYMFFIYIYIYI